MFIRSTLVLASLAMPLMAQDTDAKAASTQGATAMFYKAYFLDNDQARNKEASQKAFELYSKFLAASPDHALAGKAASRAVIILYSTGDLAKARAFAKKHDALITKAEKAATEARSNRGRGGNEEVSAKLGEAMQAARDGGNDAERNRLMAALRRTGGSTRGRGGFGSRGGFGGGRGAQGGGRGGQGGRGGFGAGRGGRGGRGGGGRGVTIPKIADMKKEDAQKAVETMVTGMERMIDFMAQSGKADAADKLEAKLDKIQDLVDDGKLAEAQKVLDTLQADMGSSRGGDQGGRRRRGGDGGDAGGAGGERRRRRGGDGGDGGDAGGERRRRG